MNNDEEIKIFNKFDEYYKATNGAVRTKHPDFNIYRLSEIGNEVITKMSFFKMNYFHIPLHRKLNTNIKIFGNKLISEEYAQVIFKPGQIVEWERSTPWEGYVIDVTENFLDFLPAYASKIDLNYLMSDYATVITLTAEEYYSLSYLYELMYIEYKNFNNEAIVIVKNLLSTLFIYIKRLTEKKSMGGPESFPHFKNMTYFETTFRFKNLVLKEYTVSKSVQYYASKLNITADFLNKCVKKTTDKTAKEVINEVLLLHIKTLLSSSEIGIKEIAFQLNFEDYSHFVKFFKAHTAFSPADFRNNKL